MHATSGMAQLVGRAPLRQITLCGAHFFAAPHGSRTLRLEPGPITALWSRCLPMVCQRRTANGMTNLIADGLARENSCTVCHRMPLYTLTLIGRSSATT